MKVTKGVKSVKAGCKGTGTRVKVHEGSKAACEGCNSERVQGHDGERVQG